MLTALDFGIEKVFVLIGENKDGRLRTLGLGEAPSRGVRQGKVIHIGDAVEPLVAAIKMAESAAGISVGTLYYNFVDPDLRCLVSRGSKTLKGEGQIRVSDLRDVRLIAERLVGHFERNIIYFREAGYTIDDRDFVANPLGVFGRKLEVEARILTAGSALCDVWQKILGRALVKKAVPVVSLWSTAYGILPKEDRVRTRLIVDQGRDFLNIFVFGNNMIYDHRFLWSDPGAPAQEPKLTRLLQAAKELLAGTPACEQILVTGERGVNTQILALLRESFSLPVSEVSSQPIPGSEHFIPLGLRGLLSVADELEARSPILHKEKGLLGSMKEKAASFLSDYF